MKQKLTVSALMAAAAACVTFSVAAQTTGSRSNPPMPSPPNAVVPNPDSVNKPKVEGATGSVQTPTTNTGNAGTDPAMKPGSAVSPQETPGATPGTAGTESGSTDLTQTEPESTSGRTTRTNN